MTTYAETSRLVLRALERDELQRLVELIGEWDVVRWLSVVPFPYTMRDAEEFYQEIIEHYRQNNPQFFAVALKADNHLIGGVGLHPPRNSQHKPGEIEIGYWLGKPFWGNGYMQEAARTVIELGFSRPSTEAVGANSDPHNSASINVLCKIGLKNLGIVPRDYKALRGSDEIIKWKLTRQEWNVGPKP